MDSAGRRGTKGIRPTDRPTDRAAAEHRLAGHALEYGKECHSPLDREGGRGVTHRLTARGEGVSLTAWPRGGKGCHSPLGREGGRGVTHRLAARGEGVSLTAWPRRIVRAARCRAGPRLRLRLRPRPRLQSPSGRRPVSRWRPRARSRHWRPTAPAPGGSGRRRLQAHCCSRRRQARRCRRILLRVGRRTARRGRGDRQVGRTEVPGPLTHLLHRAGSWSWNLEPRGPSSQHDLCAPVSSQHKQQQIEGSSCAWGGEAM
jgi:hypothetical protein